MSVWKWARRALVWLSEAMEEGFAAVGRHRKRSGEGKTGGGPVEVLFGRTPRHWRDSGL